MSSEFGSLPDFLIPIRKVSIIPSNSSQRIKEANLSIKNIRTPPPRSFTKNQVTFKLLESNTPTRFKRRDTIQTNSPLDVYDKIREELM